jgi:hypothetical protein
MRIGLSLVILLSFFLAFSCAPALAVELTPEAGEAFKNYITTFEAQRLKSAGSVAADADATERRQLLNGQVVVKAGRNNGETPVKSGLIHDWVGAIFLPSTTLASVVGILQDYSHHNVVYAPDIRESRVRSHSGDDFNVYVRIVKSKLLITDVLDTEQDIHFTRLDARHEYCRAYSTKIAEVSNAGTAQERELPVGNDRGMLWRLYGYWFLEERDGGVYAEYESITLSRSIPFGMGTVLGPILHNVPAESLRSSLEKTRRAVAGQAVAHSD